MLPLSLYSIDLISDDLLLLASVLVFFAIMSTKIGTRFGVPSLLLFLILGMVFGADGLGLKFEDYELAESIGHFAMTIILLEGGFSIAYKDIKPVLKQGILLSTLGVFLTCLLTGGFIYLFFGQSVGALGSSLVGCLLVAAIMSSTDSASVFAIIRGKKRRLKHNLAPMLELESGSNDPMAYLLTILLVKYLTHLQDAGINALALSIASVIAFLLQVGVGLAVGVLVGKGSVWLFKKVKLSSTSLYSILVLSIAFFVNGVASMLHGNGLLALYVTALIIGNNASLPQKKDILKFFDGMTWLMQLLMFLMLGLLARPSQMPAVALPAVCIALFMMFLSRPISVLTCLLPFRKPFKTKLFTSWVGLKGAGPILFALTPVVAGLEGSAEIFNIVFVITLLSLVLQGITIDPLANKLDLTYEDEKKVETFGLDMPEEMGILRDHLVTAESLERGDTLRDMHLPHGIRVVMVKREERFLVPHGSMKLMEGDHLVIVMGESDD